MLAQSLPILKMIPKEDKNNLLEDVFEPFPDLSTLFVQPFDMSTLTAELEGLPKTEPAIPLSSPELIELSALEKKTFPISPLVSTFSFFTNEENLNLALPESYPLPMPSIDYDLSERLATTPLDLEIESDEVPNAPVTTAYPQQVIIFTKKEPIPIPQIKIDSTTILKQNKLEFSNTSERSLPLIEEQIFPSFGAKTLPTNISSIENYKIPEAKTIEITEENLTSDIRFAKAPSGKGYIFAISLKPAKNATIEPIQQNYTFLIDRTNSIPKHHFTSFKKATLRALSMLQEEDTFNIVVFDRKARSFSKTPVHYSKEALENAEIFLNKEQNGGLFAAADLYELLPKILPSNLPEDEVNTVILLTDGTTDAKKNKQTESVKRLLESTRKKLTLYTAAVSQGNNLKLLETLSSCTGGSLLYSDTYAAFPRRLAGLIYRLREPLAKDLTITINEHSAGSKIELHAPPYSVFHSGQPFEIIGTAEKLDDFTLMIQGIQGSENIRIKKKIHLSEAKKDSAFVMKKWNIQKNRVKFEQSLESTRKKSG